jgi:hypothetical protein
LVASSEGQLVVYLLRCLWILWLFQSTPEFEVIYIGPASVVLRPFTNLDEDEVGIEPEIWFDDADRRGA